VKFLNLKFLPTENYDITSTTEAYIGNLDSDSTDSQEFQIQIKRGVPAGKMPLKFEVTYKEQNSNVDHVEPMEVGLNVLSMQEYAQKQPAGNPVSLVMNLAGWVIGVVIAVIILWFVVKLVLAILRFLDNKLFKKKG